jgi:hypothetical protein
MKLETALAVLCSPYTRARFHAGREVEPALVDLQQEAQSAVNSAALTALNEKRASIAAQPVIIADVGCYPNVPANGTYWLHVRYSNHDYRKINGPEAEMRALAETLRKGAGL